MRTPIILALIVIITMPKDVHGLADDISSHVRTATAAVTSLFDRSEDPVQVADARLGVSKSAVQKIASAN